MPGGARLDAPGTLHHVMLRGIERGDIVYEDEDREDFLARMGDHAQRQPVIAFLNNSKVS